MCSKIGYKINVAYGINITKWEFEKKYIRESFFRKTNFKGLKFGEIYPKNLGNFGNQ